MCTFCILSLQTYNTEKGTMLLKTILNRIQHYKGFVYKSVQIDQSTGRERIIDIEPRKNSRATCSKCCKKSPGYDRLPERLFMFVPMWSIPVLFRYRPRRVNCNVHGVVVEHLPWAKGKSSLCNAFRFFLSQWARLISWSQVADRFGVSWDSIFESIKYVVDHGLKNRDLSEVQAIGVDEIAIKSGHKYATVVYQIDAGCRRLLWIGKDRKAKTLLRFFHDFGKERTERIKVICSDMWKPYLKVIAKKAVNAVNVLDRFHIMKMFNDALDKVRREESAKLSKDGYEPVLKNTRWILAKRPENLTDKQRPRLKELLSYNIKSVRAYLLREDFQQFWEYVSHWFLTKRQYSSGIVEAINANAKMTIRTAHGFRQFETLKYALFHKLGGLPLPQINHKFF